MYFQASQEGSEAHIIFSFSFAWYLKFCHFYILDLQIAMILLMCIYILLGEVKFLVF